MLDDHRVPSSDSRYQSMVARPCRGRTASQNLFTVLILILGCWLQPSLRAQSGMDRAACEFTPKNPDRVPHQGDNLWDVVQHGCQTGGPGCFVDSIIVKDTDSAKTEAYLLIPLPLPVEGNEIRQRVPGIECKKLVTEKPVSEMWNEAWTWAIGPKPTIPRGTPPNFANASQAHSRVGMAVNSIYRRGEGQLHIHISCVNPHYAELVRREGLNYGFRVPFTVNKLKPAKDTQPYQAVKVETLTGINSPFKIAVDFFTQSGDLASQGIAVIPIGDADEGFYVLDTSNISRTDGGHAEDLLNESCSQPSN
jgi:hypothetical protein